MSLHGFARIKGNSKFNEQRIEAVAMAERLIYGWWNRYGAPIGDVGLIDAERQWFWRTQLIGLRPVFGQNVAAVRLEIFENRPTASRILVSVDFLLAPPHRSCQPSFLVWINHRNRKQPDAVPEQHDGNANAGDALVFAHGKRRFGFTLIEVVLACLLASILSVAALQVLRTTLVDSRKIATQRQLPSVTWLLREQMAIDIGNARGYRVTADSMILGGFLTSDRSTGARTQQLSIVTYRMIPHGNRNALERSEVVLKQHRIGTAARNCVV